MFHYRFIPYYLMMIFGTYIMVVSGFDWLYLLFVSKNINKFLLFFFDLLGFLFPTLLIATSFFYYLKKKNRFSKKVFYTFTQAVLLALASSMFIKVFTGRVSPPLRGTYLTWVDNSHMFQFGFMREQIFGGFPSSHATVMFAIAFTFCFVFSKYDFKKYRLYTISLFVLATLVGLGVTLGFHWFSEFFAGCILGYLVAKTIQNSHGQIG